MQRVVCGIVFLALVVLMRPASAQSNRTILPVPPGLFGVGFIFNGRIDDFGFTFTIDQARVEMIQILGRDRVMSDYIPESITDVNFTIPSDQCKSAVNTFASNGYGLIVAPSLFSNCLQWAHATYSNMYFLLLGSLSPAAAAKNPRIATGFPRVHEARYISGLIAGAYSKSGKIGFVTAALSSSPQSRYIAAMYSGARKINPNIEILIWDAGGFDNITNQEAAANDLVDKGCDVLSTNVNPLTVHYVAKQRGVLSIFSDGDARILVGESVLTSVLNSWTGMFVNTTLGAMNRKLNNTYQDIGYSEGAVSVAPFGSSYYSNEAARALVEPIIVEEERRLRAREISGVCGVGGFGIPVDNVTGCMSHADINFSWNRNVTSLASLIRALKIQGRMVVPLTEIYVRYTDGLAQAFVIIAAIVVAFVIAASIMVFVLYKREHLVIKYASPPFMYIINIGAVFLCVAVFIVGGSRPGPGTCDAALWLTAIGVNAIYAAILSKAGRLWYILNRAAKLQKVTLPNKVLLLAFMVQSLSVLIILILGTALRPFEAINVTDLRLPPNTVYVYCRPQGGSLWPVALIVYQGLLAAVGLFFAFKTRHLFDELNESREITMITYNMLFVGIVIILLLYIVQPTPDAMYAIEVVGICWFVIVTLAILYFPKIYHVATGNSMHSSNNSMALMGRAGTRGTAGQTGNSGTTPAGSKASPVGSHKSDTGSTVITDSDKPAESPAPKNRSLK